MVQSALNAAGLRRAKFAAAKAGAELPKRKLDAVTKDFSDTCMCCKKSSDLSRNLYIYIYGWFMYLAKYNLIEETELVWSCSFQIGQKALSHKCSPNRWSWTCGHLEIFASGVTFVLGSRQCTHTHPRKFYNDIYIYIFIYYVELLSCGYKISSCVSVAG